MCILARAAKIWHMGEPAPRWLVLIAGPIRSGKSTLARYIAERFGGMPVGFGDAIRERTLALGLPSERASWQQVGERWVAEDPEGLCDAVLAPARDQPLVVVDGVRHRHVCDLLRAREGGRQVVLVYVDADLSIRRARLERDGTRGSAADRILAHSTETELPLLRAISDIVADGTGSAERVLEELRELLTDGGPGQNRR